MEYSKEFIEVVKQNDNSFIGLGNPNSRILLVGKEVSTDPDSIKPIEKQNLISYRNNVIDWAKNIKEGISQQQIKDWIFDENLLIEDINNNPLFAFKGSIKKHTSNTWKNYQKLHDIIFNGSIDIDNTKELNFQNDFFITEISDLPSPKTKDAQQKENFKINLEHRKNTFFRSNFIQQFPIVILACYDYIWNKPNDWQINNIFNVKFDLEGRFSKGEYSISKANTFWAHYNENGTKLVIHTRQLSMNVSDEMLKEMGNLIRNQIDKIK